MSGPATVQCSVVLASPGPAPGYSGILGRHCAPVGVPATIPAPETNNKHMYTTIALRHCLLNVVNMRTLCVLDRCKAHVRNANYAAIITLLVFLNSSTRVGLL
ncbi:hypothetical protein CBL_06192 [Carabus blaptoides fortunei]